MPTSLSRHDDDESLITLHDVEVLTGWADLAGFVVVAIGRTLTEEGMLRVHMAADTSDPAQVVALLGRVSTQLARDT